MINVNVEEELLLDMLLARIDFLTEDKITYQLFEKYYNDLIDNGVFDGINLSINEIVDNDYINNTTVLSSEQYEELYYNNNILASIEYNGQDYYLVQI